jgi:hypothetical protein
MKIWRTNARTLSTPKKKAMIKEERAIWDMGASIAWMCEYCAAPPDVVEYAPLGKG